MAPLLTILLLFYFQLNFALSILTRKGTFSVELLTEWKRAPLAFHLENLLPAFVRSGIMNGQAGKERGSVEDADAGGVELVNGEFLVNIARLGTHLDQGRRWRRWEGRVESSDGLVVASATGADGRRRAWSFISLTV